MNLRNICIIAHVDHGKTTLVDHLLRQAGTFKQHEALEERVMDSGDLERERGITILAKNTSVRVGDTKINIVDTPGHADFGGEVERIMRMVDGAMLLVDAAEGPLPQTRFVLQKALKQGHKMILVINKVDRPECRGGTRIREVIDQTFDLFVELGANDDQADFPIIFTCAREGWCTTNFDDIEPLVRKEKTGTLRPMFDLILKTMPAPKVDPAGEFQMLVSNLSYSDYVGRLAIGRVLAGKIAKNQKVFLKAVNQDGVAVTNGFTSTKLFTFEGLKQQEVEELTAGDIAVVSGTESVEIGDTIVAKEETPALPRIEVEKPSLAMVFSITTSPLAGKEGEAIQSRKLKERLVREVRNNVALRLEELDVPDRFRVLGRGELQFGILIEQMRREGFEFMVGRPEVLMKTENGQKMEPMERAVLDLPEEYVGDITSMFQQRKGILSQYKPHENQTGGKPRVRLEFEIPTRGLLGIRSKYLTMTRGEGLFSTELIGYAPQKSGFFGRNNGAMIADRSGPAVEYALFNLEERAMLFIKPGTMLYEGMVIGECNKDNDMNVNACKEKKLTNVRSAGADVLVTLSGIREMTLERCIEWIDDDEWIEVTPKSIRIRKKILPQNQRSVVRGADSD
jgi:GTP-binding protein